MFIHGFSCGLVLLFYFEVPRPFPVFTCVLLVNQPCVYSLCAPCCLCHLVCFVPPSRFLSSRSFCRGLFSSCFSWFVFLPFDLNFAFLGYYFVKLLCSCFASWCSCRAFHPSPCLPPECVEFGSSLPRHMSQMCPTSCC